MSPDAIKTKTANEIMELAKAHCMTYLDKGDTLPIIVATADPKCVKTGISIQRNYPLTLIERSYGIPFGRLRSNAAVLISNVDQLHGYKWSIETHEAIFAADAAMEESLKQMKKALEKEEQDPEKDSSKAPITRRVPIELSTGLGNVLQNPRSLAYLDRTPYMVIGERPDHPPPYACLVESQSSSDSETFGSISVEILLFNELGGCQKVDKDTYFDKHKPIEATRKAAPGYENKIKWAVSGYPLRINEHRVSLEMTTRNVSDFRHIWKLPRLQKSIVAKLKDSKTVPQHIKEQVDFYMGFEEIRDKKNFVLATREDPEVPIALPMELTMTEEWLETMCSVCHISKPALWELFGGDGKGHALKFDRADLIADFERENYTQTDSRDSVVKRGDFFIDDERDEVFIRLLPAVYPHHIVGILKDGTVVNISICGQSGRSGITIDSAKDLCAEADMTDALIFDNGNDVFARIKGGDIISHKENVRKTRLTAGLHFASVLDPGPRGGFEILSDDTEVTKT